MRGKSLRCKASLVAIAASFLATNVFAQVVDKTTMNGKVMPGYQGWFFCPGDGNDPVVGWRHWSKSTTSIGPNLYHMDLWPEVAEYPSVFNAPGVTLTFGGTAQLYSAITPSTVDKHFEWMKNANIDGVYLQRFLGELADGTFFAIRNTVMQNIMAGAAAHGRVWAMEWDISGANESTLYQDLVNDWIFLSNTYNIRNHSRYLYHNGKPVIVVWGLGYQDRPGTPAITNQIINFFKNDPTYGGCYVVGGVPPYWRTLQAPSKTDPAWAATYRSWNCINPWTVGAYNSTTSINNWKNNITAPDVTECNNLGIKYMPTAWPGFSWDNLFNLPPGTSVIDRRNGQHLWDQAFAYLGLSGVNTLFMANFDECDEGTAIFKISDNVPTTNHWIGNNGYPQDWHMRLTGAAGQMARGEIPLSGTIPISPYGSNCLSGDVSINLGATNVADAMTLVSVSDGDTQAGTIGGRDARRNVNTADDFYFYFGVDDAFMFQASCGDVWVKVDYYDAGGGSIMFQYDAVGNVYKQGPSVTVGSTNTWKTATFHVTDAYFGNRQNGGADFRLFLGTNVVRHIDVVRVAEKGPVSIFTTTPTSGSAPLVVAFNGTASYDPNGTISSYAWIFGDGGTGTGSTINHTYAAGNYTARLTVTDNNGNTDFTTIPISVSGSVTPYFTNSSFENGFSAAGGGYNGSVGTGWTPFIYTGVASNMTFADETGAGNFDTGSHSQKITAAAAKEGGVYNRFSVTSGQNYTVTVRVKSASPAAWCFMGIDPTGGTNPLAGSVIWPADNGRSTSWQTFSWTGQANGSLITLFLDTYDGAAYWDTATPASPSGPVTLNNSAFPSNADGWNIVVWHTGPNLDGTMAWQSTNGNPTGNMRSAGSGGTNNTDSCTREGGEINKAVSTAGYNTLVQVVYDVRFETNQTGTTCIGSCPVLEGNCADKLAVYYSTAGTAGPWTLLEAVNALSVTQNVWSTRTINCPAAANNKPNFAVRFRWQFNTSTDGGRLDNVKVIATP